MVKIGGTFYVSSVDKVKGAGHLFKIDAGGNLLADLPMGQGAIYHPGGIDYDGTNIWVPVAEPDSRAIIYRVDPRTMTATEVLRFADHIGAIVHNTDDRTLHGVSLEATPTGLRGYFMPEDDRSTIYVYEVTAL